MTAPPVRWALSPHDSACHALEREQADQAEARGYAEAICGHTMPGAGLSITDAPSGPLCFPCAAGVASDLDDPGPGGPPVP